jgi:hypothetical protein
MAMALRIRRRLPGVGALSACACTAVATGGGECVEFLVGEPEGCLAVADAVATQGGLSLVQVGGEVREEGPDEYGQVVPTPFTGHRADDVTHLLRTELGTASVRTYKKQARKPLDQRVTALLLDWVTTRTQAKNGASDGNL